MWLTVLMLLEPLLLWLLGKLQLAKPGDSNLSPEVQQRLGRVLTINYSIAEESVRLGVTTDALPLAKKEVDAALADVAAVDGWLNRPSLPDPSDVSSLRSYELASIQSILTGILSARFLSQTDKDVLNAMYSAVQEDDAVTDAFLAKVVGKLAK